MLRKYHQSTPGVAAFIGQSNESSVILYEPLFSRAALGRTMDLVADQLKCDAGVEAGVRRVMLEVLMAVFAKPVTRPVVLEVVKVGESVGLSFSWGERTAIPNPGRFFADWMKAIQFDHASVLRLDPKKLWVDWLVWVDAEPRKAEHQLLEIHFEPALTQMHRYMELALGTVGARPDSAWSQAQAPVPGKLVAVENTPPSWSWVKRSSEEIHLLEAKLSEFKRVNQELVKQLRDRKTGAVPLEADWNDLKSRLKTAMEMLTQSRRYADEVVQENTDLKNKQRKRLA